MKLSRPRTWIAAIEGGATTVHERTDSWSAAKFAVQRHVGRIEPIESDKGKEFKVTVVPKLSKHSKSYSQVYLVTP